MPYALVLVAERFGALPWELEDAPTDRLLYYFNVLGVEGETKQWLDSMSPKMRQRMAETGVVELG